MWSSCQAGTRKAEGSAALPSGVQQRCPRAPTPEPDKGRPTQETGNLKGEKCFCPGVLSSPCPGLPVPGLSWFRVAGSPALLLRVPVCFVPPGVSFYWPAGVAFQLPAGGTSGEAQGHRPKNRPFLVSLFTQYFLPFSAMFEVELHGLVFEYTDTCITFDRHFVGHVFSLGSLQVRLPSVRVTCSYREQVYPVILSTASRDVYFSDCFSICLFLFVVQKGMLSSSLALVESIVAYCPALNKRADFTGVKVEGLFKGGHYSYCLTCFVCASGFGEWIS